MFVKSPISQLNDKFVERFNQLIYYCIDTQRQFAYWFDDTEFKLPKLY